ncbi:hypothetical protein F4778DRAFT_683561 [Xylariomycetidae sp. FL2044]|nr:hypothetical protein F4778DRAFT_683561 [Xylariomycetidae sp. FL2044]
MASYHRVLEVFDRSVNDNSVECDYDIHPWEILINGERWPGKTRLIGFVDVLFLMCYSADARFEKGIIVYKDDETIRDTLRRAHVEAFDINLDVVNQAERNSNPDIPERYFKFDSQPIDYIITSLGHEVGLKTEYPKSSLQKYEIKMLKSKNRVAKQRIRRGVTQHSLLDLMHDAIRLGMISHADMVAQLLDNFFVGSATHDAMRKYLDAFSGSNRADGVVLSNEA